MEIDDKDRQDLKEFKPNFFRYVGYIGLLATLRLYRTKAINRVFNAVTKDLAKSYRIVSFMPLLAGAITGAILMAWATEDPWWSALRVMVAVASILLGSTLTIAMSFINVMFFRHVSALLVWCAARAAAVIAVFAGAGFIGGSVIERLTVVALAAALYFLLVPLAERVYHLIAWHQAQPAMRKRIALNAKTLNDEQVWRICVHEAGHACAYVLLRTLPQDACAGISTESESTVGGYAWGLWSTTALDMSDVLVDMILIQLVAATLAEELVLGSRCFGDSDDRDKFDQMLKYRAPHLVDEGYVTDVTDPAESRLNLLIERRHRRMINEQARRLVAANRQVIVDLATELRSREFLDSVELMPFWRRMTVPAGLRVAEVPASIPSWPADMTYHKEPA